MNDAGFLIYVAEDNEWYQRLLVHQLSLNPDYEVKAFSSGKEVLDAMDKQAPKVLTLDYRLGDMTGEKVLSLVSQRFPDTSVIIVSEQGEIETAVELLKMGAFDYLVKSDDIRERLHNTIQHIRENEGLRKKVDTLKKEVQTKFSFEKSIIGQSKAIQKIFTLIEKAIQTNITVNVTGETGTGKEVVAKAIHYNSKRKDQSFVAVNMSAIPAELIESELFGHEKGAFTGAATRRKGKFEEAHKGTLFLDEIGEMDINFQAKLLRAIQEKEITRIGGNETIKVDCRIIVATHRNLLEEVKKGNFREDLYYRLSGLPIALPPLRDRDKDVLILAMHFIRGFCKENDIEEKKLDESAKRKLLSHTFPGNVRELKSVVELAAVMSSGDEISAEDLTLADSDALPDVMASEATMREYNRRIVNMYMERFDNDTKKVADALDIGQTTVYRLLKEDKEAKVSD